MSDRIPDDQNPFVTEEELAQKPLPSFEALSEALGSHTDKPKEEGK